MKPPALTLPLLLLFLISQCPKLASAASCHPDDEAGLLGFKSAVTADPSGILASWKPGTDCCAWGGVTCRSGDRVTSIWVSGQLDRPAAYLSGTISPSLSKLQDLEGIYLMNLRNISGRFPDLLFRLPKLGYLYIENNKLSGQLPAAIGKLAGLEALSLEGNEFSGPIPGSISELTRLTQLKLGGNSLSGAIPGGIRRLKNLTVLSLERNRLTGPVPDYLGSLTNLRFLQLSHNKLSGGIPATISGLAPTLAYLELGHNALTGQIPDFLSKFRVLDTLDLSSNKFHGVVPKSFANLTKIFNLDLSRNLLVDPFPQLYVKGIESLDLSYNRFKLGQIPSWVTSSPIIYSLKLANCGIKMRMEDWKPKQTYFYDYIDLSENQISGSPVGLLNRTEFLVGFGASGNMLRFDMGGLKIPKTMKQLDVSRNLAYGKVPAAVSSLESLNVSYNHLCGKIPDSATKFAATSFVGNDCLCGPPLGPCKG
ncbi:LRRNT_2 domain-containing protein [Psidium guajava]|nr:LRRNT_2 domain-containing protein [Psidium guajava]